MKWILALALVVAGCTHPMPRVPPVATDVGGACIDQCQGRYESCVRSTTGHFGMGGLGGAYAWGAQEENRQATNACRDNLAACYTRCAGR